ncbi:hypothetical protein Q0Z83_067110 [Actinoplanes sichuanensis]|uniref:Cupin domain-containing protein n=1 Tax=Actinoplanes sichuanensis TaxID=512349 RepID=A0ABW4AW75_9ACTN|nr:hypothetical protein [Actinoplanes sichuanensis]BEL08520.1 hypothetical protein Q0Z83_067110 [Actinoplanes sichuanensis]
MPAQQLPEEVSVHKGEIRVDTKPGDYIHVPPWVPHREENPDPDDEAVVVISRTTQEAIVVNVPDLKWVGPVAIGSSESPHL